MAVRYTTAPLKVAPAAATSIAITPSATAWASSAWAVITAATSEAWTLCGITVDSAVAAEFEIDVGKGVAGLETVVATFAGNFDSTGVGGPNVMLLPIAISGIASGDRVVVRIRKVGTSTVAWRAKVLYWPTTSFGSTADTTTQPQKCAPTAAVGTGVSPSGTSWGNSSWGTLLASTSSAITILGVVMNGANAQPHEIDIGTGTAGSEVVKTTLRVNLDSAAGGPDIVYCEPPLQGITSGTRIAVRFRKNGTNATSVTFKLLYMEGPL